MSTAVNSLTRFGNVIQRIPVLPFVLLLLPVQILRTGIDGSWIAYNASRLDEMRGAFPRSLSGIQEFSIGPRSLLLPSFINSPATLFLVSLLIASIGVLVAGYLAARSRIEIPPQWLVIVVVLGPVTAIFFQDIDRFFDVWVGVGALLIALRGTHWQWAVFGNVMIFFGSPEQALPINLGILILALTPRFADYRRPAIINTAIAVGVAILLAVLSRLLELPSRFDVIGRYVREGLWNFFVNAPISLYAGLGALILFVAFGILNTRGWQRFLILAATVLLPLAVTATTLDQTRILALMAAAPVLMVTIDVLRTVNHRFPDRTSLITGGLLLLFLLLPPVHIFLNSVISPYRWINWVVESSLMERGVCLLYAGCV